MGWSFSYEPQSKSSLIKERTERQWNISQTKSWTCLAHAVRGNVLWTVWEIADISSNVPRRFIGCDLLGTHGGEGWGYKDMSEEMHPYFYSCPLSYLEMVPVASEEWRAGVRAYHAKRKRKFSLGETIELVPGCKPPRVTLTSIKPLVGTYEGRVYKVAPRHIA